MSFEYKPTIKVPERPVWLRDHPGATVEDFDREHRPFSCVHSGQHRRRHVTARVIDPGECRGRCRKATRQACHDVGRTDHSGGRRKSPCGRKI